MSYVHAVPGRLRLKSRALASENRAVRAACHAWRTLPGVEDVTHKPRVSSVIVLHDPAVVDTEALLMVARDHGLAPADLTAAAPRRGPEHVEVSRAVVPSEATGALLTTALTTVGGAVGKALFGAVVKTSLERGVASLVTAAIR